MGGRCAVRAAAAGMATSTISPVNVAAGLENELADQGGGYGRRVEVRTALEAMRGIGVQAVPLAAAAYCRRIKPGCFHQNIFGLGGDHRVPTAHDAGQPDGLLFIGDDQVFRVEHTFDAI